MNFHYCNYYIVLILKISLFIIIRYISIPVSLLVSVTACHQIGPGSGLTTGKDFSQLIQQLIIIIRSKSQWTSYFKNHSVKVTYFLLLKRQNKNVDYCILFYHSGFLIFSYKRGARQSSKMFCFRTLPGSTLMGSVALLT